jgi:hypothetical protein
VGTVEFKGDPPFDLKPQRETRAVALSANVILTFPVFVADIPGQVAPVEIAMNLSDARWLRDQLQIAIRVAEENERLRGY